MSDTGIEVPYHRGLGRLEEVLAGVRRAGDFVTHGSIDVPMPRVEVESVGVLSIPVPAAQVRALVRRAERAPYQPVTLACRCADCRELQAFARDPVERVHRFPVRRERRQHLHGTIERHGLDMTHVTERKGSPQTLVCTKTLRTFERRCEQHRQDVAALATLASLVGPRPGDFAARCARIAAARRREPRPFTPP